MRTLTTIAIVTLLVARAAFGALTLPLSEAANGSDGDLNVAGYTNLTIDLSQAPTGTWDQVGNGSGVYDPQEWAVVYKYNSVSLPSSSRIYFSNNPSGAPVVWLVKNSVNIYGSVYLNGADGHNGTPGSHALPGPGGFRGGIGTTDPIGSAGFGPGGASLGTDASDGGAGGSYSTQGDGVPAKGPIYGNTGIFPLIGGSGGSGARNAYHGGGGGGGALLIVAADTVNVTGAIYANGGNTDWAYGGPGAGGAIRIVADVMQGGGNLSAMGGYNRNVGYGGRGRIRVEANDTTNFTSQSTPPYTYALPGTTPSIWPDETAPKIVSVSLGAAAVPADPKSLLTYPHADVQFDDPGDRDLLIQATNVPVDGTWKIAVRIIPKHGLDSSVEATYQSGDQSLSTWQATISVPNGFTAVQARAYKL